MLTLLYILFGCLIWSVLSQVAAGYRAERRRRQMFRTCRRCDVRHSSQAAARVCEMQHGSQLQSGAAEVPALIDDSVPGCDIIDAGEPPIDQWVFARDGELSFTGDVDIKEGER